MKEWFVKARLGSFALAQFLLSVCWAGFLMIGMNQVWLVALAMASYIPAGWFMAWRRAWPRGDNRSFARSVLLPALLAWLWAGLAFLSLSLWSVVGWASVGVICSAFLCGFLLLLASPSVALGLLCFSYYGPAPAFLVTGGAIFVAGLLPPLLFWLGGWMGSRPAESPEPDGYRADLSENKNCP